MRQPNANALALYAFLQNLPAFSLYKTEEIQMKNKKKKRKGFQAGSMRCPYCGSPVIFRSADGIYHDNSKGMMLYVCSHYPQCDAYVRVHVGTNIPVGSLANHELRTLRRTAHQYFDQLHQSGYMSKQDAYQWLADLICAPLSEAHIGHLGEYYCKQVIEESRRLLDRYRKQKNKKQFRMVRGGVAVS
jgi:ssDNA-binding Zn-finger/Zn-ribbon topoisomerase 1